MMMSLNNKTIRAVFVGVLIGFTICMLMNYLSETASVTMFPIVRLVDMSSSSPTPLSDNWTSKINFSDIFPARRTKSQLIHTGESDLSDAIRQSIRIVCWVMTMPSNQDRALTVRATWGKRCNVLFFVSTAEVTIPKDDNSTDWTIGHPLLTVIYPGNESRSILWGKTKMGFQYAYDHFFEKGDWFIKADDDTFLIIDNLRLLLLDKDPAYPVYYGCKFKPIVKQGYMSGGAGYVLSKEALKRFIEQSKPNGTLCRQDADGAEDAEMGKCLESVGVEAGDSRDAEGQVRWFPFTPQSHAVPTKTRDLNYWYWQYIWFDHKEVFRTLEWPQIKVGHLQPGVDCCSDSVIAFHYVDRSLMWTMEFIIYHVHPFGVHPKLTGSHVKTKIEAYLKQKVPCNVTKTTPHTLSKSYSTLIVP